MPNECFEPISVEVISDGATNEDLARAYRDNIDAAVLANIRADRCAELNGAEVE